MSHLFESGMFNRGEPAWHGLGKVINNPGITIEEAIVMAGLDWHVNKEKVYTVQTVNGQKKAAPWEGYKGLVRSTDGQQLSIVGSTYHVLQNVEAFQWFDPFMSAGEASIESAGALDGGRKIWILANLNAAASEVATGDKVKPFLLLAHSHDGTMSVTIKFTVIRVVCWNTLSAALGGGGEITIKHTKNMGEALEIVREGVNTATATFEFTLAQYRALAKADMGVKGFEKYVREVFEVPEAEDIETLRAWGALLEGFQGGRGVLEVGKAARTVWGGYNAVTEWVQHTRGRSPETRLEAAWFGEGAKVRDRAFKIALDVAGVDQQ
jgi:phage/plasmid-like protein (TIGR03299 family)